MRFVGIAATTSILLVAVTAGESSKDQLHDTGSPVQKVIVMMKEMKKKSEEEKHEEMVMYAAFKQWCDSTEAEKAKSSEDNKALASKLQSDIESYNSDAKVLGLDIVELDASISSSTEEKKKATAVRKEEHDDFQVTQRDYAESLDEIAAAQLKLKRMLATAPSSAAAASLLQEMSQKPKMRKSAKHAIASFLAESSKTVTQMHAPEAAAYESSSGTIVQLMENLEAKLKDEKQSLEKDEMNRQHAYEMIAQTLTDEIQQDTDSRNAKVSTKKGREADSAQAKGDLAEIQAALAKDKTYLTDLRAECKVKTADFQERQKLRGEELKALGQAIEVLSDAAVSGSAVTKMLQVHKSTIRKPAMLTQLWSSHTSERRPSQGLASSFLQEQGQRLSSNILLAIANKVGLDPFAKVKKMVSDMVTKLMEEQGEEAEHQAFCDKELGTNKQTRDQKSALVDELTASIEQMQAESQQCQTEVTQLSEQISDSDAAVAKATTERQAENAKNEATISDAKSAALAVQNAIRILKAFYEKSVTATALIQLPEKSTRKKHGKHHHKTTKHTNRKVALSQSSGKGVKDDMPAMPSQPFTGTAGGVGVIGILQTVVSDMESLVAETSASEESAAKEYKEFMADAAEDKAVKSVNVKHKAVKRSQLDSDVAHMKRDLKSTQEELQGALDYFNKLKPSCVETAQDADDRAARRKAEIESLEDALRILAGEDIPR